MVEKFTPAAGQVAIGGETIWFVAGFLGSSEKVIRDTYGDHSTDTPDVSGFVGISWARVENEKDGFF
jgi:hypothetical protein